MEQRHALLLHLFALSEEMETPDNLDPPSLMLTDVTLNSDGERPTLVLHDCGRGYRHYELPARFVYDAEGHPALSLIQLLIRLFTNKVGERTDRVSGIELDHHEICLYGTDDRGVPCLDLTVHALIHGLVAPLGETLSVTPDSVNRPFLSALIQIEQAVRARHVALLSEPADKLAATSAA